MAKDMDTKRKGAPAGSDALHSAGPGWLLGGFARGGKLEWVKNLIVAVGLALIIRWLFAEPFRIPSGSMEPTLHGDPRFMRGDRVFVNKLVYGTRWPLNGTRIPWFDTRIDYAKQRIWHRAGPKRWDIVVFKTVESEAVHTTLVKRVVGLPGERIHIANGKVYVNGQPLELPPGMPKVYYTSPDSSFTDMKYGILEDDAHAVVPPDSYLLLGDNSRYSRDGRYFGWVPNEHILGRVACIWWPFSRWRDFTGFSLTWWWRSIAAVIGLLLVGRLLFGRSWPTSMPGGGGKPKVSHLYINRWAFGPPIPFTRFRVFRGRNPQRGALVLYRHPKPEKGEPDLLIGRVAGLPGERVAIDGGRLSIDNTRLSEPASLANRLFPAVEGMGPFARSRSKEYSLTPEDHFFILAESDLPEDQLDSRTLGWVAHANLVGTASVVWWPPTRWSRVRK